jgi:hypothetical protein
MLGPSGAGHLQHHQPAGRVQTLGQVRWLGWSGELVRSRQRGGPELGQQQGWNEPVPGWWRGLSGPELVPATLPVDLQLGRWRARSPGQPAG